MVNHYLLSNEELINRLCKIIEESAGHIYDEINHTYKRSTEYWDIKKELMERMKQYG